MKLTYVNPSFLDYRVPVYGELDRLVDGGLTVVYSRSRTPERVARKVEALLGSRAVGLTGESTLTLGNSTSGFANAGVSIPYQPGLLKTVMSAQADVVISEGLFQWTPAAALKRTRQRIPLVISYERTAHTERNCPWWRTAYRRSCLRLVAAVVCNGRLSQEYIESLGVPRNRIVTGGMAADSDSLRASVSRIAKADLPYIRDTFSLRPPAFMYVGRLVKPKGLAELLRGWDIYKNDRNGPGSLLLVGGGNQDTALRQLVEDRVLPDVHFAGEVDYDDIAQFYAAADVFVMPTLEDNWSLAVAEAMACGLPIACSKYNGGWPELVQSGKNGVLFDPLVPEDTADALTFFASRQAALEDMGGTSQHIVESYTPHRVASRILEACQLALAAR